MSGPVETPEGNIGVESTLLVSDRGTAKGDVEMTQHIRSRYAQSPGVIQTGLIRQIGRLTTGRPTLLAALQRRLSSGRAAFRSNHSVLVHIRRAAFGSPLSLEGFEPQLAGEVPDDSGARALIPEADGVPGSQILASPLSSRAVSMSRPMSVEPPTVSLARDVPGIVARSGESGPTILQRCLHGPLDRAVKGNVLPTRLVAQTGEPAVITQQSADQASGMGEGASESRSAVAELRVVPETRATGVTAASVGDREPGTAQRDLGEPAERAILRRSGGRQPVGVVGRPLVVTRVAAGPAAAASEITSEPRPADGEMGVVSAPGTTRRAVIDASSPATAIVRRHLGEPAEQANQRRSGWARSVGVAGNPLVVARSDAGSMTSASEDTSEAGPADREAETFSLSSSARPDMAGTRDLGTAIAQRHLGEQTGQTNQRRSEWTRPVGVVGTPLVVALSGAGLATSAREDPSQHFGRHLNGGAEQAVHRQMELANSGPPPSSHMIAARGDAGSEMPVRQITPPMRPSGGEMELTPPTGASVPAESARSILPLTAGRILASNVVSRAGGPAAMGPTETLFARTASDEAKKADRAVRSGGGFGSSLPAMPLLRTAQHTPAEMAFRSAIQESDQLAVPGVAARHSANSGGAQGPEAGSLRPVGEPVAGKGAMPKLEGPELERVANEVYAIIERRLIIERESLGL
jgi:hypothetical protein